METRIYKYTLKVTNTQEIEMPKSSRILSVQDQNGEINIWAVVWPHMEPEKRTFEIFGTGHALQQDAEHQRTYIGTVITKNGHIVWHIFERLQSNFPVTLTP